MKSNGEQDYKKIIKIAESLGAKRLGGEPKGMVWVNGKLIDLTASGDSVWAVAKNIISQLKTD